MTAKGMRRRRQTPRTARTEGRTARGWLERVVRDESGASLTELLVGAVVGTLVMGAVASAIFTATNVQRRGDDRSRIAGGLSVVSLSFDRDAAMATATAPAKSQTTAAACTTEMDLGFLEGGASVRFRTVSSGTDGPSWFQRVSGSGTRTIARHVAGCTWQTVTDAGGDAALRLDLTITGPAGDSVSQTLRAAPRLW